MRTVYSENRKKSNKLRRGGKKQQLKNVEKVLASE